MFLLFVTIAPLSRSNVEITVRKLHTDHNQLNRITTTIENRTACLMESLITYIQEKHTINPLRLAFELGEVMQVEFQVPSLRMKKNLNKEFF